MNASDTLAEVLRSEGLRVLATLARTIGDLSVAEDALSEATISALDTWPKTGIPDNPRAWLAMVARRKALDLLRRESARSAKETAAFRWGTGAAPDQIEEAIEAMEPETSLRDDMLRLIFTCCHPALGREAQVALSLRTHQIQAHLAAAHSTAPSWRETDWDQIVGLYDLLGSITANPVVALNRAIAVT